MLYVLAVLYAVLLGLIPGITLSTSMDAFDKSGSPKGVIFAFMCMPNILIIIGIVVTASNPHNGLLGDTVGGHVILYIGGMIISLIRLALKELLND